MYSECYINSRCDDGMMLMREGKEEREAQRKWEVNPSDARRLSGCYRLKVLLEISLILFDL